jgi:hypothetical protein
MEFRSALLVVTSGQTAWQATPKHIGTHVLHFAAKSNHCHISSWSVKLRTFPLLTTYWNSVNILQIHLLVRNNFISFFFSRRDVVCCRHVNIFQMLMYIYIPALKHAVVVILVRAILV